MCLRSSVKGLQMLGAEDKKRLVVVGGGIGGAFVAHSLQFVADVVLIDQKEYFEISWAGLRSMVEPSFAERSVINHTDYLPNARIVSSAAMSITDNEVFVSDGSSVPYDYLVVATGHEETVPKSKTERLSQYQAECEKIKAANTILIIGGGPTGVELAAEIAVDFPEKNLKLIHRGSRLMEFVGFKASQKALNWLTSKKVEVILQQSISMQSISEGVYRTSGGETIAADCHFMCTGKPIGSQWLKETVLTNSLDIHGRLMVDKHMRVRGFKNVFAVGDITDLQEIKQGYLAERHAHITSKNLKVLLMGGNERKLATYKLGSPLAIVSLGRKEGVAQLPFTTISGCIPGLIKSGDLFVGKTRKELGLAP
ncbi:apoptosis-inducing factor homolog B-like [Cucurbita maxima]|uniref:Apoptosis-inducing factor homolog B-like n=1 Tax=Cucurbita maxima TaxID=3661 RepID=A0A6J1HZA1_CUCMA|nr:apoptosis-inducing factor homolog B-like [Cucurbita maxima]